MPADICVGSKACYSCMDTTGEPALAGGRSCTEGTAAALLRTAGRTTTADFSVTGANDQLRSFKTTSVADGVSVLKTDAIRDTNLIHLPVHSSSPSSSTSSFSSSASTWPWWADRVFQTQHPKNVSLTLPVLVMPVLACPHPPSLLSRALLIWKKKLLRYYTFCYYTMICVLSHSHTHTASVDMPHQLYQIFFYLTRIFFWTPDWQLCLYSSIVSVDVRMCC